MLFFLLCFNSMVVEGFVSRHRDRTAHRGRGDVHVVLGYGNRSIRSIHERKGHDHHRVNRAVQKHHKYGGSIRPHNKEHAELLRSLISSHGGDPNNVTHREKDLANMAAHRNLGALRELYNNGSISPETAGAVLEEAAGRVDDVHAPRVTGTPRPGVVEFPPADRAHPDETYVAPGGVVTGRTNREQVAIDSLLQSERPIDDAVPDHVFSSLVSLGHSTPVAKGVADEVRDSNVNKELRMEKARDMMQPAITPMYVTQEDLAQMANSKDTVPLNIRTPFVNGIYEEYLDATGSPKRARFEASQAGLLIDEYNAGLRGGLSPAVAYGRAMDAVGLKYKSATRAAAIRGGGQRVAQGAADKVDIEDAVAREMVRTPPEQRIRVLKRKEEVLNARKMDRAKKLNKDLVETHVKEPIIRAHQKLQQAAALKDAASREGLMNPVVQEKILTDVVAASAEDSAKALGDLQRSREQLGPNRHKTNALNLLSKANTEKAIANINRENEEKQKKAIRLLEEEKEQRKVKMVEERLAQAKERQIIRTQGENAFTKTYERTGDIGRAGAARRAAERAARERLAHAREVRETQVMRMIGPMGTSSEAVHDAVKHIATAHAGLNAVGTTLEDLNEKYEAEMRHQANTETLMRETATTNLQVKEIIPPTTSKVGIVEGRMKLPLKGFSGEEATTEEERLVQSGQKKRRGLVRNRVVGVPIESGLNVIETQEGYIHIPEAAKSLKINKGKIFYPEDAKGLMEKQNLDTSALVHRFNTGERGDLDKGVGYYEADVSGYTLNLPSPSEPVPTSTMTNGEKTLSIEHGSGMYVESGDLIETPWNEFVKEVRPTINGVQLQEDEVMAASEMKARAEGEKKLRNLEGITTEVYTNPDGSKFVEVSPPYGVPELMTMDEAIENLNSVGSSNVAAVSEESKKQNPDVPLDMATTVSEKGSEEGFIDGVLSHVSETGEGASGVSKQNSLNGEVNSDKAPIAESVEKDMIDKHLSDGKTLEASVKNAIVHKAEIYARSLRITTETFLNMISQIPESSIKEMMNYNQTPANMRKDISQTQFYNEIVRVLPTSPGGSSVSLSAVTEILFNNIAVVTHTPNSVGGEIVERVTVPNLKAIEQVEIKKTPSGTTETAVSVPNQPGKDQVLGEVKMKETPAATLPGSNSTQGTRPTATSTSPAGVPSVPSNPRNPLRPGVSPMATRPVQARPPSATGPRPDHKLDKRTYAFNGNNKASAPPGSLGPLTSGFTGRVPKAG